MASTDELNLHNIRKGQNKEYPEELSFVGAHICNSFLT